MLTETYRPKDWQDVIAQDKAKATLKRLESSRKLPGEAYWISGKSGTGKTTIARIIASKVAAAGCITEIDAGAMNADMLAGIESMQHFAGCTATAFIVNEAHGLRRDIVRRLLVLLERLQPHTTIIFTTTVDGQLDFEDGHIDAHPLLSRCIRLSLSQQGLAKPFAERVREIAVAEALDGQSIDAYLRLAKNSQNNFRAMLMPSKPAKCSDNRKGLTLCHS